jgi:pimeloyl-ACP methyl ester carboxylesterase
LTAARNVGRRKKMTTNAEMAHRKTVVNGVRLHYVEAGNGPLVVLLHGFPEFWYSWRHQIAALAAAGFRVIAPDMRGYNLSEKPRGVHAYRLEALTADVAELIRHAGAARATVVGHDWGGVVAWQVPIHHPDVVESLIVLNAPHPGAARREIRTLAQLRKSWYVFFFQLPGLPEWSIRRREFAGIARMLRTEPLRRGAFTEEDVRHYQEAISQPGALTAALNYYRALFRQSWREWSKPIPSITIPTLVIWGEQDPYLGLPLLKGLEEWVPNVRVERVPDASHWIQVDAPEQVNRLMIEFLRNK